MNTRGLSEAEVETLISITMIWYTIQGKKVIQMPTISRLFLTVNIISHIVFQSNLYANQAEVYLCLSIEEFEAFLGILVCMGISLWGTWTWQTNMRLRTTMHGKVDDGG